MPHKLFLILWWLLSGLWFGVTPLADAFTDHGHVCFQLSPFVDVLDLHVKQPDPTEPFFALGAVWRGVVGAEEVYRLEGGGSAYGSPILGVQLTISHDTAFFDANRDCPFHATINLATVEGPWTLTCFGNNAPFILAGGDLVLTPCATPFDEAPPADTLGTHLAGDPR